WPNRTGDRAMAPRGWSRLVAGLVVSGLIVGFALPRGQADEPPVAKGPEKGKDKEDSTAAARDRMVQRHLAERGIKNPRVLEAFRTVPRHRFLPPETRRQAYDDESIPIGEGQTITPP